MRGQWVGDYAALGQDTRVVVDIDERRDCYEGVITLFSGEEFPVFEFYFRTADKGPTQYVRNLKPYAFRWGTADALSVAQLQAWLPTWTFARDATFGLEQVGDTLCGAWSADIAPNGGTVVFEASRSGSDSEMVPLPEVSDWASYKAFLGKLPEGMFYRGQGRAKWKLRTAFHRAGRSNMHRFIPGDVSRAYASILPALGGQRFDLKEPLQLASFLHLLQHHGYPTPLLDWSKSPYVAAFFAFQDRRAPGDVAPVRVNVFAPHAWERFHSRVPMLTQVGPVISVLEALPLANPRSRPQQSVSTATNIDDLEGFVLREEQRTGAKFLFAIDLPYSERTKTLRDLQQMGITAENLFGGLDGACRAVALEHIDFDMAP